jgi:hypothetical protein
MLASQIARAAGASARPRAASAEEKSLAARI